MKILNFIFLTLFILILANDITAQITIEGTITDANPNPISNDLVEIIDQDDTTNYYRTNTNESVYSLLLSNIKNLQ